MRSYLLSVCDAIIPILAGMQRPVREPRHALPWRWSNVVIVTAVPLFLSFGVLRTLERRIPAQGRWPPPTGSIQKTGLCPDQDPAFAVLTLLPVYVIMAAH